MPIDSNCDRRAAPPVNVIKTVCKNSHGKRVFRYKIAERGREHCQRESLSNRQGHFHLFTILRSPKSNVRACSNSPVSSRKRSARRIPSSETSLVNQYGTVINCRISTRTYVSPRQRGWMKDRAAVHRSSQVEGTPPRRSRYFARGNAPARLSAGVDERLRVAPVRTRET